MSSLLDRVTWNPEPAVGPNRTGVATLVGRLEAGTPPLDLEQAEGLAPGDLLAALAAAALGPENSEGLPLVQSRPSRPRIEPALHAVAQHAHSCSLTGRLVLAAGLLQIFDFWDASHTAAQEADDRGDPTHLGTLWHAIAHRREPDPGNSSY